MIKEEQLSFQKITPAALGEIAPFFAGKYANVCDMSVAYLHMWGAMLRTEYAICEGFLFLRRSTRHGVFYYPPLVMGEDADLSRGMEGLSLLAREGSVSLCALPERMLKALEERYDVCDVATSRDYADYVYHAEALANLAGKKLSKKRNLVHQFEKLYADVTFEALSRENIPEAVELLRLIMRENADNRDKVYENNRVLDLLGDYEALGFSGGALRVGGKLVAFCVGELIDDTLYVHVEKGSRDYKGVYQYINRAYVRYMLERATFLFVNREDDAGDEGLRQAKLSYSPAFLAYKHRAKIEKKR